MRRRASALADLRDARVVAPHEVALRIAEALYGDETGAPVGGRTFDLAGFQDDAVRRARHVLRTRGGVLIADSVGLGKTYIALALIEEELGRGGRVLVATPAALRSLWRAPLRKLAHAHRIGCVTGLGGGLGGDLGAGELAGCDAAVPRPARAGAALGWVSHTRLSRGLGTAAVEGAAAAGSAHECDGGPTLVVVDEAHAFRNRHTRRYRELARICFGAQVVLLTATPVNNTLLDLYSQVRLFAGDTDFRDLGVGDLRALFREAAPRFDASPAPPALLSVLRAIMIRRTRLLLRESGSTAGPMRFPQRAPPRVLHYDLEASFPGIYAELADCLDALTFAPFRITAYATRRANRCASGAAELMRIMMLKRLESSVAALASSLDAQIAFFESFIDHSRSGRLLRPADHRMSRASSDASAVQLVLGGVTLDPLPRAVDVRALVVDAAEDLRRMRAIRARLMPAATAHDVKLARLRALLEGELAGEHVLVFTEFRETARHIWVALRDAGGTALIHGGGAFLGRSRCGRREVVERFAPKANRAARPPAHEAVRILIATDVLSEGMNLQDARHVVSYDLPWNPVRLIQRIGRIDRLGSHHERIFAHTFVPQRGLERLLGLLERIRVKLATIHGGVGLEAGLPHELAASAFLDRLRHGDPSLLDEIERHDAAPFEAEERLRLAYLQRRSPDLVATGQRSSVLASCPPADTGNPDRARQDDGACPTSSILLALRTTGVVRLALCLESGMTLMDPPAAFETLTRLLVERPRAASHAGSNPKPKAPDRSAVARALMAVTRSLDHLSGSDGSLPSLPRHGRSPAYAVSRQLLDTLARVPGGPDAKLCARAERLLAALGRGGPAGLDHALAARHSANRAPKSAAELCDALEVVLAAHDDEHYPGTRGGSPRAATTALIGAIEFQ